MNMPPVMWFYFGAARFDAATCDPGCRNIAPLAAGAHAIDQRLFLGTGAARLRASMLHQSETFLWYDLSATPT
jgi:hypothetical protein